MWVGLLIFYVTFVANVTNVRPSKSPKTHPKIKDFRGSRKGRLFFIVAFCWIYQLKLLDFPTVFTAQKPYLCTEFQSALKLSPLPTPSIAPSPPSSSLPFRPFPFPTSSVFTDKLSNANKKYQNLAYINKK